MSAVCVGGWGRPSHGALVARSRRAARSARGPRGRGAARPYPPDPYPRQAELAGFCALSRACCASRRCFCARARSHPSVCALPARSRRGCSLRSQPPGVRGYAPLPPPDPYPRQAELAGFCALRARAALRAGCFCARARSHPHVCAGARSHPPARSHPASSYHARMFFRRCVSRSQNCRAASALSPRRLM